MHRLKLKTVIVPFMFCILLQISFVNAQSSNYWSWSFNTNSALLAGAVVAGGAGPSAVFYNPALIDQQSSPSLTFSANVIALQYYSAENVAGKGINAYEFSFKVQPKFISFVLPSKNKSKGIELAVLSPVSDEISYTTQHIDEREVINRTEGPEQFTGYMNYRRRYDDTWIGGGYSKKVSSRFSYGASAFLSAKVLDFSSSHVAQAYQLGDSVLVNGMYEPKYVSESSFNEDLSYWYLSFIFKAGIHYVFPKDRFSLGLNVTLPDLPVYGRADIVKSYSRINVYDNDANAFTTSESSAGYEKDLSGVRVKNPFALSFGARFESKDGKTSIAIAAEYFSKVGSYDVIESSQELNWVPRYVSDNISGNNYMSYAFEAKSVTNTGIGVTQYFGEKKFALLVGFRTDFRTGRSGNGRYVNQRYGLPEFYLNKYHFSTGSLFIYKRLNISAGFQYSFGKRNNTNNLINYAEPLEYQPETDYSLEGVRLNNSSARFDEISIFISVAIDLQQGLLD
jgi:hypothetical protein